MTLFSRILILFLLLILDRPAFAARDFGIGLEPYAGYGFGSINTGSYDGFGLGARAVVTYADFIFLGPDLTYYPRVGTAPDPNATSINSPGLTVTNLKFGLVGGVLLPLNFRLWVGYNFIDNFSQNMATTVGPGGTTFYPPPNGNSFKVGVGWSPFNYLSINAEYSLGTYSGSRTPNNPPLSNGFLFSLSAPVWIVI